jgi:hypothetical protein
VQTKKEKVMEKEGFNRLFMEIGCKCIEFTFICMNLNATNII